MRKNKKYIVGRENFALTIFIPVDCKNNCPFCTSKKEYVTHKPDILKVREAIKKVGSYHIVFKDVVITGGEPLADIGILNDIIIHVKWNIDYEHLYINTTFPLKNAISSSRYVNSCDEIDGVNISRHLDNCFSDQVAQKLDLIEKFGKSIHINCVVTGDYTDDDLKAFVVKYKKYGQITFRADYTKITQDNLKSKDYELFKRLDNLFGYVGSSSCNVCNTDRFGDGNIVLHRGTESSHLEFKNFIEVNDLIIKQDGEIRYDWGKDCKAYKYVLESIAENDEIVDNIYQDNKYSYGTDYSPHYCGIHHSYMDCGGQSGMTAGGQYCGGGFTSGGCGGSGC